MYKALLLDLDDTLIKSSLVYDKALEFAAYVLAEKYKLDMDTFFPIVKQKDTLIRKNFPSVHTRHSRILVYRHALDQVNVTYHIADLPEAEDLYWEFFDKNIELYPHVIESLTTIRNAGVSIAIVSDGDLRGRIRKVKAVGLDTIIHEVIASEEVIFEKPFSAIFTLALSRLKVQHNEAVMVGNNYKNDIQGAQLVGIPAILFAPPEHANIEGAEPEIQADYIAHSYTDIKKIVLDS